MNWLAFGGSAVVIGMLAASWGYIRVAWSQLSSRVIVSMTVYEAPATGLMAYLLANCKKSTFGPRSYSGRRAYVRPISRFQVIVGEELGHGTLLFWKGWRPLWVTRTSASGGDHDNTWVTYRPIKVTFLRGTFNADELAIAATETYNRFNTAEDSRYKVYHCHGTAGKPAQMDAQSGVSGPLRHAQLDSDLSNRDEHIGQRLLQWKTADIGPVRHETGKAVDDIAMSDEMRALWDKIQHWRNGRSWFNERGLTWRYGALFHGEPGNGKTLFVRTIAEDLDMPVFSFDLATFYNDELRSQWAMVQTCAPAIILIEDIDGVFNGRKAVTEHIKLSFDSLLNCIDGVERVDGTLLFITTNNIATLDPALGGSTNPGHDTSRPGRVDCAIEFRPPDKVGRAQIAKRILRDWPAEVEKLVNTTEGLSGAQFERRCVDLAEKLYWSGHDEGKRSVPLLCSCGEGDCEPGYLLCPACIARDEADKEAAQNE